MESVIIKCKASHNPTALLSFRSATDHMFHEHKNICKRVKQFKKKKRKEKERERDSYQVDSRSEEKHGTPTRRPHPPLSQTSTNFPALFLLSVRNIDPLGIRFRPLA